MRPEDWERFCRMHTAAQMDKPWPMFLEGESKHHKPWSPLGSLHVPLPQDAWIMAAIGFCLGVLIGFAIGRGIV